MSNDDWRARIRGVFEGARERPPEERRAYLAGACGDDEQLRFEVESMLAEADDSGEPPAPPSTTDPLIGKSLGRYRIIRHLGQGGMGTVYVAEDEDLRRNVALKVLPERLASDPRGLERFKREARSAAALAHPNIVTLHSVEEDSGTHFLTMELVPGEPLDRRIPVQGLELAEILDYATQLTAGLRIAHEHGIVHRDLKPANLIVDHEGRLRILDFGLAKLQPTEPSEGSQLETSLALTGQGAVLGTVPYMSPEQVAGEEADRRSDIFSVGVILYQMCTAQLPFPGANSNQVMSAILRDDPNPVTRVRSDLPLELERIVHRCLEKKPAQRYQSAVEVQAALETLQTQVSSHPSGSPAMQPGATPRPGLPQRRLRTAGVAAILAIVLLAAGYFLTRKTAEPAPEAATTVVATTGATDRKMLAVLPFENLGAAEDEYFAAGMTEEITARLATVSELGVIASNSARQYAGSHSSAAQIGAELGADYLVTGSVRWANDSDGTLRIRITPKLVSTADETQVWAESYDRVFADIFSLQTDIANRVVELLDLRLVESERLRLEDRPTENMEAYLIYLESFGPADRGSSEPVQRRKIELYEQVVALDPDFAEAWKELAIAESRIFGYGYDTSDEQRRRAWDAVQRTIAVSADNPDRVIFVSLVYHFLVERDYERVLHEAASLETLDPNRPESFAAQASALRRMGRWEEAAGKFEQASRLDPRAPDLVRQVAHINVYLGRFEEALAKFDATLELQPSGTDVYTYKARVHWIWKGDPRAARREFDRVPAGITQPFSASELYFWQLIYEDRPEEALAFLDAATIEALGRPVHYRPLDLLRGVAYGLAGENDASRAAFGAAAAHLEAELEKRPDYEKFVASLGLAYAALGRHEEAIALGIRATELLPLSRDPYFGQTEVLDLAWIYTLSGEPEKALESLEILLSVPSEISIPFLRMDPRWEPLLDHPGFAELEERYG